MGDVTGMPKIKFNDRNQIPSPKKTVQRRLRGIKINYQDKFCDSKNIPESETWDIDTNSFEKVCKNEKHDVSHVLFRGFELIFGNSTLVF
jgi:hypothetical protein